MGRFEELLTPVFDVIKEDVINSMHANNRVATGETMREIEVRLLPNKIQLLAPEYIDALEQGRKPTRSGAPASDPTLSERLKAWCRARGIDENRRFAIARKIHREGYKGTPGVLTEPLSDQNVNSRMDEALGKASQLMAKEFADTLKV